MGHSLDQLGSATLDGYGGLFTNANPQDLPEGASPRCYDVDFIVGSVFTRAGLQSVYSFSGKFVGPNGCNLVTDVPTGKASWVNPTGIEGIISYASVSLGALSSGAKIPSTIAQTGTASVLIAHTAAAESGDSTGFAMTSPINTIGANFIAVVAQSDLTTNGTLTDSLGNTWTAVPISGGPFEYAPQMFYCNNPIVGGFHTFTFTHAGGFTAALSVQAYAGVGAYEATSYNSSANDYGQPGLLSPNGGDLCIVGASGSHGNLASGSTVDSNYTITDTADGGGGFSESHIGMAYLFYDNGQPQPYSPSSSYYTNEVVSYLGVNYQVIFGGELGPGFTPPDYPSAWEAVANGTDPIWKMGMEGNYAVMMATFQANGASMGGTPWLNLSNITKSITIGGTTTTLVAPRGTITNSSVITLTGFNLSLPIGTEVAGVLLSIDTKGVGQVVSTSGLGSTLLATAVLVSQLTFNGAVIGSSLVTNPASANIGGSAAHTYTLGSSSNTWGVTGLDATTVNDSSFGLTLQASLHTLEGPTFTDNIALGNLVVTVYYPGSQSDELWAQSFTFAIPDTVGITGIGASFNAFGSAPTSVTLQLLKDGVAVGAPKTQLLTTTPTNYTLGEANDQWGATWVNSDLNNTKFGVQITAAGDGTTSIQNVRTTAYITASLVNFNYIKTYEQNSGQTYTMALDANGIIWQEDVTNDPNVLSPVLTGIIPGSFAKSATFDNREHILFSNLAIGTDRPRVYNGTDFDPLSQIGPGAPPNFVSSIGTGTGTIDITGYSLTSNIVTFTFSAVATAPVVGSLYLVSNVVSYLNGNSYTVLATPAPSTTAFSVGLVHPDDAGGSVTGKATPEYSYGIINITQPTSVSFNGQELIWSAPGDFKTPGNVLTMFYGTTPGVEDKALMAAVATGNAVYLYITGAPIGNGTWLMTGHGLANAVDESGGQLPFISITYTSSGNARYGGPQGSGPNGPGNTGSFQQTLATIVTATAVPNISSGDTTTITGVLPTGWNSNWTIVDSLNSMTLNITSTAMSSAGVATYGWDIETALPGITAPVVGQIVLIINCTNAEIFNTTGVIQSVVGSFFTVDGFTGQPAGGIPEAPEFTASAVTFGTQFTFDPGALVQPGANTPSIFGEGTGGDMTVVGGVIQPIGAGIRQGVCFFITENGYESPMSPPIVFTTSSDANFILASQIPIGPPDTVARGIAFTESGQNGVPGANFYVIEDPVTVTVENTTTTYTSTIINDNVSTTAKFSFTDAVLLNSREVDVQGDNLFNLIELGSSGWCVAYHERMFYGLQLNKIDNWTTGTGLTFDQGYLPNPGGNIQPLGWTIANPNQQTLLKSTVTGNSLYIFNDSVSETLAVCGLISQTAFQDPYQVPIINTNTTYSVRVAASAPSGLTVGTLVVDLFTPAIPQPVGSFSIPLADMTTNISVFTGTLLTVPFLTAVPPGLIIRVYVEGLGPQGDCEIDRIEVFPTLTPYLKAQVYGSYVGQPEAIDGSAEGGIIDTSTENAQACMGGFVMRDLLFLLKTNSMYSTEDNPNSEPGGWGLHEVSNLVGTIGINSYDVGEEWMVTACRAGIFGFNGGQPVKISQEIWNLWECINWNAGNTIVLRNDIVAKRMYIAVPLPTGTNPTTGVALPSTQWLPNAPYNPTPTTPNVIIMMNYQGLATFEEMISAPSVHTTMFFLKWTSLNFF